MRNIIARLFVGSLFAAVLAVHADAKVNPKSIVVESPQYLPELAQRKTEAMYLHESGDGRTVLYLEQDQGRTLALLDVSDPSTIRALAQVPVGAASPYDFVQDVGDSAALIRYRDHAGYAVINFKKFKHPVLFEAKQLSAGTEAETLGRNALLMTAATRIADPDPQYQVVDISNPCQPVVLASIEGVLQRLDKPDTGTVFLLGNAGLTVIRNLKLEEDSKIALNQMYGG